jgi:murein peptide amidase A
MKRWMLFTLLTITLAGCHAGSGATVETGAVATSAPAVRVERTTIGQSVQGVAIECVRMSPARSVSKGPVLLFAAIHGDETTTAPVMEKLVELLEADPGLVTSELYIVPVVNPDGLSNGLRANANRVDLNRNFPATNWKQSPRGRFWNGSEPLSEPESRAVFELVNRVRPVRILSLHSIRPPRHGNNFDGPARAIAELMALHNGYAVLETMGYPTPGSFGSWAGIDLQIPTITLELSSRDSAEKAWKENREALLAFIRGR